MILLFSRSDKDTWRDHAQSAAQVAGLGESAHEWLNRPPKHTNKGQKTPQDDENATTPMPVEEALERDWKDRFVKGTPKPVGQNYTRVLVIPKIKDEDISWMEKEIPDVEKVVYVADDPNAALHPPENKGHEAMVYLTYIIDNYEKLPDIMLFMHAHQKTWHNNDVFNADAAEIVRRLSSARVMREGYMNLRCQWYPGCPDWMHPGNMDFDIQKTEQVLIAKAWVEIFPFDPVPDVLAQPCCSQFALSRERIHSIPKKQFEFYRKWILSTQLHDEISGRVWEYMWQYAFTGQNSLCPVEHICYCDGYGACFGGKENYDKWNNHKTERDKYNIKLLKWQQQQKQIDEAREKGDIAAADAMDQPEPGKDRAYWDFIQKFQREMNVMSEEALKRGEDPKQRALEAGRRWKEGDGF